MSHLVCLLSSSLLHQFQELDIRILTQIFENRNPSFDSTFIFITNTAAAIAFGVPLIMIINGRVKKKRIMWRNGLTIILAVATSAIVANILKYIIDLPRPYEIYPFIEKLSVGGSPTFPSGHTADAFAFAVAAALIFRKWFIVIPSLLWASVVGYSRMCLGVHFPSDVLGGALVGAACAGIYYWMDKKNRVKEE
jgi:membrane-associated phospholipid phosphatase